MAFATQVPKGKHADQGNSSMDKAKDAGAQAVDKAKEAGTQAMAAAKEAGGQAFDKAKEAGGQAFDKAKEAAREAVNSMGEMASHAVCSVEKKADDLTASAGGDIRKWGDNLAQQGPQSGLMGKASHAVAETLQDSGHYLEDAKLSGMANDVAKLVQRHPMPAILIGFGIGVLVGRALRS